ncbi:hypothetical protein 1 [Hubei tombus-like virus 16]|uniref:hypothetical protein 1 n=1 Tax=Hubei tombus-like virus 16 TaxID=1923262 RepID=UPI000909EC85|nr:hypothetical protein 1 [Hubei tombus-like virus 16]APG76397.1 hypothetical protein 1 [Hubei tombus-like virus 16]
MSRFIKFVTPHATVYRNRDFFPQFENRARRYAHQPRINVVKRRPAARPTIGSGRAPFVKRPRDVRVPEPSAPVQPSAPGPSRGSNKEILFHPEVPSAPPADIVPNYLGLTGLPLDEPLPERPDIDIDIVLERQSVCSEYSELDIQFEPIKNAWVLSEPPHDPKIHCGRAIELEAAVKRLGRRLVKHNAYAAPSLFGDEPAIPLVTKRELPKPKQRQPWFNPWAGARYHLLERFPSVNYLDIGTVDEDNVQPAQPEHTNTEPEEEISDWDLYAMELIKDLPEPPVEPPNVKYVVPERDLDELQKWNFYKGRSNKHQYYFKGEIQKQQINCLPELTQEKQPLFKLERVCPKPMKNTYPTTWDIWGNRKWLLEHMETDKDLLAYLRLEAAFVPRTPALLLQLKVKAKRFMDQLDCSLYTREEINDMIIRAVGAATLIGKEEEKVRALMNVKTEKKMREKHHAFFREGNLQTGNISCPTFTPKKLSALARFRRKLLTRVMPF